jgi:hypothetical protein
MTRARERSFSASSAERRSRQGLAQVFVAQWLESRLNAGDWPGITI